MRRIRADGGGRGALRCALALACLVLAAAACDSEPAPTAPPLRAPEAVGTIPGVTLILSRPTAFVDVASHFTDPDGDVLRYAAASSDSGIATASISGSTVTVTRVAWGEATVTVTASDPGGLSATQSFTVTVPEPPPPPLIAMITPPSAEVGIGGLVDFAVATSGGSGDASWTCTSSDTAVATVETTDTGCRAAAVAAGGVTITVAITKGSESMNVAAQLTVSGDPLTATMNPASDSVEVGGRAVFAINISGSTGIASWTCSSSDTGVATARMVAEGCEATGVAEGSATVTAIVQKGGETVDAVAQLTVFRVVEPPVYTVELHEAVYLIGCDNYKITAFAAHYPELGAAGPWGSWGGNGLWTSAHGAISMRNACLRGGSAWKIGPDGRTAEEPSYELYTRPFTIVSSLLQEPHLVVDPHLDYRFPPDYDPNYDKDTYEPTGDEGPDVALVRIAGDVQVNPRLRLLPKDAHIAVGDRVRAAGFSENKPTATFADAIINDIKRVGMNGVGDTEHTWLTAGLGMRPGASGSPVIDDDGYVVGILVTARRNVANKDNDIVHADELWDLGCRSSGECNGGSAH